MLFRKKDNFDIPRYEADDEYYMENYYYTDQTYPRNPGKPKKGKMNDDYYYDVYEEYKSSDKSRKIKKILIGLGIYLAFLTLGICSTSFTVNELGHKEAQIVTVTLREERRYYDLLAKEYNYMAQMIEDIKKLDQRFLNGEWTENAFALAAEYEDLLPTIDIRLPRVKALEVPQKYNVIKTAMVNLYKDDIALYLQNMSKALATNNATALKNAVSWSQEISIHLRQLQNNLSELAMIVKLDGSIYTGEEAIRYEGITLDQ